MTIQELVEEENQRVIVLTPRQLKEFAMTILEAEHQQLSSIIKDEKKTKLLSRSEAMQELHVCSRTLNRWASRGYLPSVKVGKKNMYRREDIDNILKVQTQ
jgi:cob(I)alamin adenosyltransferase